MDHYDPEHRNRDLFLFGALAGAFAQDARRAQIRATNPKQAVTCQECYSVWIPRKGLPINYCSNCGEEIDHNA